ncbi:hypothetical protein GTW93_24510, partial [Streptomyces sp. SID5789]|nr:hypothetical protein [Streptomyces sp. SID5789]
AYAAGLHTTMWIVAAACAVTAVVVGSLLKGGKPSADAADEAVGEPSAASSPEPASAR